MSLNGHLVEDLCLVGHDNRMMVIVEDGWFDLVPYKIIMMIDDDQEEIETCVALSMNENLLRSLDFSSWSKKL